MKRPEANVSAANDAHFSEVQVKSSAPADESALVGPKAISGVWGKAEVLQPLEMTRLISANLAGNCYSLPTLDLTHTPIWEFLCDLIAIELACDLPEQSHRFTEARAMQISSVAASVVNQQQSHQPPAQAARSALENRPDLQNQPFGHLVSLIARGQPLPALQGSASADAPKSAA